MQANEQPLLVQKSASVADVVVVLARRPFKQTLRKHKFMVSVRHQRCHPMHLKDSTCSLCIAGHCPHERCRLPDVDGTTEGHGGTSEVILAADAWRAERNSAVDSGWSGHGRRSTHDATLWCGGGQPCPRAFIITCKSSRNLEPPVFSRSCRGTIGCAGETPGECQTWDGQCVSEAWRQQIYQDP